MEKTKRKKARKAQADSDSQLLRKNGAGRNRSGASVAVIDDDVCECSAEYPLGGMIEPYDIWREKELNN